MEKSRIIKYIIQHLYERGLIEVAQKLESESQTSLEKDQIKQAKIYIRENKMEEAMKSINDDMENFSCDNLVNTTTQKFLILNKIVIYEIFNALLKNDIETAIKLVRSRISEIVSNFSRISVIPRDIIENEKNNLKKCSQLLFIGEKTKLIEKMKEISKESMSTENLIKFIESLQFFDKNFPNNKNLNEILDTVVRHQISLCKFHNTNQNTFSHFNDHFCKVEKIPNKILYSIEHHNEEIINIIFSNSQKYFAAVLKDYNIAIYKIIRHSRSKKKDEHNYNNTFANDNSKFSDKNEIEIRLVNIITSPHKNQITSLHWNSNDILILTASKDKTVKIFEVFSGVCKAVINRHDSMVSSAIFILDDSLIVSSGLDYKISFFNSITKELEYPIKLPNITVSELLYSNSQKFLIVVSATTNSILFYDIFSKLVIEKIPLNDVIISCAISKLDKGMYLLVNSSKATPVLNLFNLETFKIERKFFGHRQERFINKCNFGGERERFLTCGSDDAKVYVWNRNNSIPVFSYKLHSSAINSVIWSHSRFTDLIISCSDDHTIKILGNQNVHKIFLTYSGENSKLKSLEYKMINLEEKGESNTNMRNIPNSLDNLSSSLNSVSNMLTRLSNFANGNLTQITQSNFENSSEEEM